MVHLTHTLGFPRIGVKRELKQALESYWAGKSSQQQLLDTGRTLRQRHWLTQKAAGSNRYDFWQIGASSCWQRLRW